MRKAHLIISSIIVILVAFVYGFRPSLLFYIHLNTIDEANVFKAVMGLYLAFASLWIVGVFKSNYWKIATISNMVFMLGLAFGRIISLIMDGMPSNLLFWGIVGEMILGCWGLYLLTAKSGKEVK